VLGITIWLRSPHPGSNVRCKDDPNRTASHFFSGAIPESFFCWPSNDVAGLDARICREPLSTDCSMSNRPDVRSQISRNETLRDTQRNSCRIIGGLTQQRFATGCKFALDGKLLGKMRGAESECFGLDCPHLRLSSCLIEPMIGFSAPYAIDFIDAQSPGSVFALSPPA
jgi:hypothetical protein